MGRFAEIMGLNATGGVRIELERRELLAGDWLRGVVYVNMHEAVQAEALVVVITGKEKTSWTVKRGSKRHYRRHTDDCFSQQITLATLPPLCEPGDYVYPFQYQLPSTLPGVTLIERSDYLARINRMKVQLWYTLEVRLGSNGFLVADLSAQTKLQVRAVPPEHIEGGIEAAVSEDVNFLALFSKGLCDITAALTQRAQVVGSLVVVNASVFNNSTKKLESVALQLVQHIDMKRGGEKLSKTLRECQYPGVDAGNHFTRSLELTLDGSLPPTCTNAKLFSVRYELRVKCRYSCCPGPWLKLPLIVLAKHPDTHNSMLTEQYAPLAIPIGAI